MRRAEEIALTHHERWDGGGYDGLEGEPIPLTGRSVAIVDVFDALSHDRPYRNAWAPDEVVTETERQAGRYFDPGITEAFLGLGRDLLYGFTQDVAA